MNSWQVLQQIAFETRRLAWADSPAERVFHPDAVLVSGAITRSALAELTPPLVFLYPGPYQADPEVHGLGVQTIQGRLTVAAEDEQGQMALIGGNRTGGAGSTAGRGLLEVESVWCDALDRLNHLVGIRLTGGWAGAAEPSHDPDLGYVVTRVYSWECPVTTAPTYTPPARLQATDAGGGAVTLTWALPPTRYDLGPATAWAPARGQMILRRASGATAPAGPALGTAVALGSALATGVTDTPGAGTWSYALFAEYDEGLGGPARYSSQVPGTTRTVVVA